MKEPMHILQLRASPFLGSPEKMILSRSKRLIERGGRYTIGIFDEQKGDGNTFYECSKGLGIPNILLDASMKRFRANMGILKRNIQQTGIQGVCSHDFKSNFHAFFLRKMTGIPAMCVFHGRTMKDLKIRLYYLLDLLLMSGLDAVICVSESQRIALRRFIPKSRLHVVPNAVDIDEITDLSVELEADNAAISPRRKTIVFVGRLSREKGLSHLIRAFSCLTSFRGQLALDIIGDGPDHRILEALISDLGVEESVRLLGFKENVYPYIQEAEFLVLPSLSEGMPVVILEAFALKKPVVATRVGGIPEMIRHERDGLLIDPKNERQLADAIAHLLLNPLKIVHMGNNAYRRVKREFSFETQTDRYQEIYRMLVS